MLATIQDFHLQMLNNGSHFLFVSHVLQQAEACTALSAKAAAYLAEFKKAVAAEDVVLKTSAKSMRSDGIAAADASRDTLYAGLKHVVKSLMRAPSAEVAQAAVELNQLFIDYRIDTDAPLIKETGMLNNLIDDLGTKFKEQVETLGFTVLVGQLHEANSRVDKLMVERTEERKNTVTGKMKAVRVVTDEAYRELVRMVNGLVYVDGESGYVEFVKFVNAEILYFRREALGQKGSTPKGDGSVPGTGGTGDGEPGTETPGGGTGDNENPGGTETPGGSSGGDDNPGGSDFD